MPSVVSVLLFTANMKKQKFIVLCLGLSQSFSSLADTDDRLDHFLSLSLEELVNLGTTIATNTKHTIAEAPAIVTVITSEDIKATGATNLVDVLEGVPGVHVRANHFAFRPLVHFRGAKATQTLLMVNGNPLKDLMWGFGIFWKGLPVSMVERVEIIRGPGSALFGADASAGVINIITKTAGKIESTEAGVRIGSFDSKTAWMQYGDDWAGYQIGLTAEVSTTDGYDPFIQTDGQTLRDQSNGTNVSSAPGNAEYGWRNEDIRFSIAKDNWRLHTDYMRHSDLEVGLTGAGVLDPVTHASDSRFNLDLIYDNASLSKDWGVNAELSYQHLDYTSGAGFQERPPGYADANGLYPDGQINHMRSAERRLNIETSSIYTGIADHELQIGVGHTWQDLYFVEQFINSGIGPDGNPLPAGGPIVDVSNTPYSFAPEKIRRISYLFIQDVWGITDGLELTVGARYDDYSDFGDTLNPRLALVWKASNKLTTKLMYGQAFRAPSYQELFSSTSVAQPNPDLKPESSETIDLGFAYAATRDVHLSVNLFRFAQTDLIRAIGSPRQFQNVGDNTIRGIELEGQWQVLQHLRVSGNYTVRSHNNNKFRSMVEPKQDAYLRVDWSFQHEWNWNIQTSWIGERDRSSTDSRRPVDDYFLTDTTVRYVSDIDWEFAVSVRNLFDIDAREFTGRSIPDDLPLPERNVHAEIRYKF